MMRPSLRAVGLFAASVPVCLLLLIWKPALWPFSFDLSLVVLVLIGIDALLVPPPGALAAEVTSPSAVPVGSTGMVGVRLALQVRTPEVWVNCALDVGGPAPPPPDFPVALHDGAGETSLPFSPVRRGVVRLDAIWVRWRGPLGLVECRSTQPLTNRIEVLPARRTAYGPDLVALIQSAIYGTRQQAEKGEGTEFSTLREHVAGLDSRFIDWKHSARHRRLLSKEFQIERNHQIVLAFDTGHLMLEPIDGLARLDHAIEAGLILGATALRAGDLVGSFAFDIAIRHYLEPGRGASYYARLQRSAARLGYHAEETNFTLGLAELNARLKRRALVILFTDFVDSVMTELLVDSLRRMANRHVVVFVALRDPLLAQLTEARPENFEAIAEAVIAHDFARDREVVLERIARLGIQVLDVPVGQLSTALLNRYLAIKQAGLL